MCMQHAHAACACSLPTARLVCCAQVRVLARQHAFGGFARFAKPLLSDRSGSGLVCTRHHCIDWNFVGTMRTRPNKWRVKPAAAKPGVGAGEGKASAVDEWLELSYADDDNGAPYYHERWRRFGGGEGEPALALRARPDAERDAMLVVVGDHFAYVAARPIVTAELAPFGRTLPEVVDNALARGRREVAEACVLLEAGHGRVSDGWRVGASLQPWRIGRPLGEVFRNEAGGAELEGGGAADGVSALEDAIRSPEVRRPVAIGGAVLDVL